MAKWFTEAWTSQVHFSIQYTDKIHEETTPFQKLEVYQSEAVGKFFTLDGLMMINERDEFIYHDMIVHPVMFVHPNVQHVLVIGGGDGGTVRELTRYKNIESIDMVEIDERVVRVCQQFFPQTASKLTDERVHLMFEDGLEYVQKTLKKYDVIIVDSTDPIGPGEGLFTQTFYQHCFNILREDGVLVNQHESPYFDTTAREMRRAHRKIKKLFPIASVYQAFIPTYPSGHWLFGFASKKYHPINDFNAHAYHKSNLYTSYYNADVHVGAFALPTYVKESLVKDE